MLSGVSEQKGDAAGNCNRQPDRARRTQNANSIRRNQEAGPEARWPGHTLCPLSVFQVACPGQSPEATRSRIEAGHKLKPLIGEFQIVEKNLRADSTAWLGASSA